MALDILKFIFIMFGVFRLCYLITRKETRKGNCVSITMSEREILECYKK